MSKQFGLIVSNKSKPAIGAIVKRPSIFDEDSDSDVEAEKPTGLKTSLKRQDRVAQIKAVEEDPTVYQYDEIYEEIDQKRKESKLSRKDLDKKPKYINKLLDAANRRKQDNERRIERQVQKEREAEGDEFNDKESFVTSAYRKKLEEMKKLEEEEKREEYLESIGDVKKQGNLDGFYRHLYDQKVNYEDRKDETKVKDEKISSDNEEIKINVQDTSNVKIQTQSDDSDSSNKSGESAHVKNKKSKTSASKRKYRKRENTDSEDKEQDSEHVAVKMEHLPSNLDADSDFSIDSASDDSDNERKVKKVKKEHETVIEKDKHEDAKEDIKGDEKSEIQNENSKSGKEVVKEEEKKAEVKPKKPKIDIWKKRTVGVIFEEALQRYFERKALREAGN